MPSLRGEGEGEVRGPSASLGGRGEGSGAEDRPRDKPPHSIHYRNGNGVRYGNQTQRTDSTCILTPPNTPLYPEHTYIHSNTQPNPAHYSEHASQEHTHTHSHTKSNGCMRSTPEHKKINGFISNGFEGKSKKRPLGRGCVCSSVFVCWVITVMQYLCIVKFSLELFQSNQIIQQTFRNVTYLIITWLSIFTRKCGIMLKKSPQKYHLIMNFKKLHECVVFV